MTEQDGCSRLLHAGQIKDVGLGTKWYLFHRLSGKSVGTGYGTLQEHHFHSKQALTQVNSWTVIVLVQQQVLQLHTKRRRPYTLRHPARSLCWYRPWSGFVDNSDVNELP